MPMLTTFRMRSRMPFPLAAPEAVGEIRHLVEHGVDLGHDVFAVH